MNRWLPIPATEALATWGFASLADAILKATCLLVIAMIATCLLRRRGAAVRHLLWVTMFGLLLVP